MNMGPKARFSQDFAKAFQPEFSEFRGRFGP